MGGEQRLGALYRFGLNVHADKAAFQRVGKKQLSEHERVFAISASRIDRMVSWVKELFPILMRKIYW